MSAILDYMRLCRLCLVKDKVNVPIFGEASDVRQIFLKISACLPVKVSEEDNLPKSICDSCLYKVDLLYQFWNTTVNAEKQLIQWLAEIGVDVNIKNSNPPNMRITPQSHAHPHSMHETIILKEERPDPEMKAIENNQNYQMDSQNMYSDYEMPYQPQVNMTVGAPTDFSQPTDAPAEEEVKVPQQKAQPTKPTPAKRRGRPPKQKTPPAVKVAPPVVPPATTATTATGSKRRSSAAAAAAAVAAAAANASSDESDLDDRFGGDDSDDEDMDVRIAKEEADSEDEEYIDNPESLEPTAFVGVPSTSACDSEQPGPSGLGGSITTGKTSSALPASAANESGLPNLHPFQDPLKVEPLSADTEMLMEDPLYKYCTICQREFSTRRKFVRHNRAHRPKIYPCKLCDRKFGFLFQLKQHEENHDNVRNLPCDICGKKFSRQAYLIVHQRRHEKTFRFNCSECDRGYISNQELIRHIEVTHRTVSYPCSICGKNFRSRAYLLLHLKTHGTDSERPAYKCEHCDKVYASVKGVQRHTEVVHENITFMCDECGKTFTTTRSLQTHKITKHEGLKPFMCSTCGKSFTLQKYLVLHIRVHTKEKPYQCVDCNKCFSQRCSLSIHKRLHTGEKPYSCNLCYKNFVSKSALTLHSKVHGTALADINKK